VVTTQVDSLKVALPRQSWKTEGSFTAHGPLAYLFYLQTSAYLPEQLPAEHEKKPANAVYVPVFTYECQVIAGFWFNSKTRKQANDDKAVQLVR
jgi:hypothetical protein